MKYEKNEIGEAAAFVKYFELGKNRSLVKLSKQIGIKYHILRKYSRKNHWKDKIRLKDEEVVKRAEESAMLSAVELKAKYLKMCDKIINRFSTRVDSDLVGMGSDEIPGFEKMVKTSLLLLGEETQHISQDIKITVNEIVKRAKKTEESGKVANVSEELKDLIEGESE